MTDASPHPPKVHEARLYTWIQRRLGSPSDWMS